MQIGRTYTSSELTELGLQIDTDNTLKDGRIATVNALGTLTDIRVQAAPPIQTPVCGDGVCETGESALNCIQDCHTGDGVCQKSLGETPTNAPTDCKKSSPVLWIVLLLAALGGLGYLAIKKGWVSNIGPFGHSSAQGPSGGSQFDLHRMAEKHEVAKPHKDLSKVVSYINATKEQGFSYSQIKNALAQKGWKESDINAAYSKIGE